MQLEASSWEGKQFGKVVKPILATQRFLSDEARQQKRHPAQDVRGRHYAQEVRLMPAVDATC